MTTWKCHDCESTFSEPDTILYRAGRCGNGSENWEKDEYIDVCPVCGSDEIHEAYICADCEKEVEEGELDEDDLCFDCATRAEEYEKTIDRVKEALSAPIDMAQMVKSILNKKEN